MTFIGGAFTPGAPISFMFAANGSIGSYEAAADAAGAFKVSVGAPTLEQFRATAPTFQLSVTANDQSKMGTEGPIGPPEQTFAFTQVTITDRDVDVRSLDTRAPVVTAGKRLRVQAIGWTTEGTTLYMHYLRGTKAVHTDKVGALTGPCGNLNKTIKTFGFRGARAGMYSVRFTTAPKWNRHDAWVGYRAVRLK